MYVRVPLREMMYVSPHRDVALCGDELKKSHETTKRTPSLPMFLSPDNAFVRFNQFSTLGTHMVTMDGMTPEDLEGEIQRPSRGSSLHFRA